MWSHRERVMHGVVEAVLLLQNLYFLDSTHEKKQKVIQES